MKLRRIKTLRLKLLGTAMLTRLRNYASVVAHKYSIDKSGSTEPRPMKFPYTFSAKISQFPFKFYMKNNWVYGYYMFGILVALPVFVFIHRLSNTPSNKATWAAIRAKEAQEHHH